MTITRPRPKSLSTATGAPPSARSSTVSGGTGLGVELVAAVNSDPVNVQPVRIGQQRRGRMIGRRRGQGDEFFVVVRVARRLAQGRGGKTRALFKEGLVESRHVRLFAQGDPKAAAGVDVARQFLRHVGGQRAARPPARRIDRTESSSARRRS